MSFLDFSIPIYDLPFSLAGRKVQDSVPEGVTEAKSKASNAFTVGGRGIWLRAISQQDLGLEL